MPEWESASFCYVTTIGRHTGRQHTIEIWFGHAGNSLYLLAGGGRRSDWVRNLIQEPQVGLKVGAEDRTARARVVDDVAEDALARRLLAAKYQNWKEGEPMSGWARTALAVALDLNDAG